ncbi:MAG: DevR family CRISPR-associated autoregulator [Anaerolineales bacterium]|nr:DevR family CRISPR-associated autoregulator [Anaerolineales bacterium]
MSIQLYSLSISARAILDMHSLNNEGGEGNQIQTRMVNIADENGDLHNVNAVSGDMFKHIQAEHLFRIAREDPHLPLCQGCREFNANRINADADFQHLLGETTTEKDKKGKSKKHQKHSDADVLDYLLRQCIIDDIEGILVTSAGTADNSQDSDEDGERGGGKSPKRSLPRKSIVEFGWAVGIPQRVETDSYFHVKYAPPSGRSKSEESREAEADTGANLGQSIFHRPASSGEYAIVCHVEFARIGYNDITQTYAISSEERLRRAKALLESIAYTFIQPNGAMRSSQAPHMVNLAGVVSTSFGPIPAPTVSPLKGSYREDIRMTQAALERFRPETVYLSEFNSVGEFTDVMGSLIEQTTPYQIQHR